MTIEEYFEQLSHEFKELNDKQTKRSIRQIEAISGSVIAILASYADLSGNIPRSKNVKLNKELEQLLPQLHKNVREAVTTVIEETASWTTDKLLDYFAVTYGVDLLANGVKAEIKKTIVKNVFSHTWENGLNLNDSMFWLSRSLIDSVRQTVNLRSNQGLKKATKAVKEKLKNERWRTENIIRSDSPNAYRETIIQNAKKSKYVEAVKITEGIHHSPKCVALASADHYGMGAGIYLPETEYPIDRPHPRCTSYLTYVMKPRKDGLFDD